MKKNSKIYVAGHNGLVGSAIVRNLREQGYTNIIGKTYEELDLTIQKDVNEFFEYEKPEYVILAAAKVGGIYANNTYPADFIYINGAIELNVIHACHVHKVKKLLVLGSTCIYPKLAPQPLKEEYLLTGPLEETNEAYAVAKIFGLEMCKFYKRQYGDNFITVMPTNLYGPFDNFDLKTSHVLPALLRKFHEAKISNTPSVEVWGTGNALREFLYVDDMANACIYLLNNYESEQHLNIGTGIEISIKGLAETIKEVVGYEGEIVFNTEMPDGTPRKMTDSSKIHETGWKHKIDLEEGIRLTYKWFLNNWSQK